MQKLTQAGLVYDRSLLMEKFGFNPGNSGEETENPAVGIFMKRSLDAEELYHYFTTFQLTDSVLIELFNLPAESTPDAYRQIIFEWLNTYERRAGKPGQDNAWSKERMEYNFSVFVPTDKGRLELKASEYPGGRLDWDSFIINSVDVSQTTGQPLRTNETLLPAPVTFHGMPSPRFWEIESSNVDFGNPEAGDRDLGRMLLAEFVLAWGNDWFMIPLETPTGSLCRVNELLVTDTFGVTSRIVSHQEHLNILNTWYLNRLGKKTGLSSTDEFLFIPPVLPVSHQSPPLEEILFLRDEMANMTWAVEKTIPDETGRAQPAATQSQTGQKGIENTQSSKNRHYQVMTDLPEHWIPFVVVTTQEPYARFFAKAGLLDEMQTAAPEPKSRLLKENPDFRIHQEEISRAGVQVSRAYQLTRWYDGSQTLWLGRHKRAGLGEMGSGLEFDSLLSDEK